jgi:hypothetical protein
VMAACGSKAAPQAPPPPPPPAPDAGPPPEPRDAVSAITAAGIEEPEGLDWGAEGEKPARELFKNVKLLGDLTGNRMMAAMQSMEASLGQRCRLCHDPNDWPSDAKPPKDTARGMMIMAYDLNTRFFDGHNRVTCYTCHLGNQVPPPAADPTPEQMRKPVFPVPDGPFTNLKVLDGSNRDEVLQVMAWFTADLGVECSHCHVDRDYASDAKAPKQRAREMVQMVGYIATTYPISRERMVGCMGCHRGQVSPPRAPPSENAAR